MGKKLQKLFEMIEEIETAMMTTRRKDGHLVSRAMATQKRVPGADLWFVTDSRSEKLHEIENDPHVNLAYYKDRTREWVSVSGVATISRERKKIRELYAEDWRAWFPDEGNPTHGTPEDPRMVLIGVKIHTGFFLEINKPQPVVLYELVKGLITNTAPDIGVVKGVNRAAGSVRSRAVMKDRSPKADVDGGSTGGKKRGSAQTGGAKAGSRSKASAASGSRSRSAGASKGAAKGAAKPAAKRASSAGSRSTSRKRSS